MPLDIPPAPPAPGGAVAGASAPPAAAGPPGLAGPALAVFGLLLAQLAPPTVSPAAGGAVKSAAGGAVKSATPSTAATPTASETAAPAPSKGKGGAKVKATGPEPPALPAAPVPIVLPVVTAAVTAPPPAPANTDKTTPGKVMDTAPPTGGESLSQTQTQPRPATVAAPVGPAPTPPVLAPQGAVPPAAAAQTVDVIVPAEADAPATVSAFVPPVVAQASQAVVVPVGAAAPVTLNGPQAPRPALAPDPAGALPAGPAATPAAQATGPALAGAPTLAGTALAAQNGTPPVVTVAGPPVSQGAAPAALPARVGATPSQATLTTTGAPAPHRTAPERAVIATAKGSATGAAAPAPTPGVVPPAASATAPISPAPAPAAMPAPDQARMVRQVADGVQTLAAQPPPAGGAARQVTVQLHPQDWGRLNVSVTMTPTTGADGKVSTVVVAHVVAESQSVKAALEGRQGDLRQALQDTGLHLSALTVTVQASSGGAQAGLGGDRQPQTSDAWAGGQPQAALGTGGTPFHGGGQQSAFAGFAQGDGSGRRPPTPYAATPSTGPEAGDPSAAPASRPGRSGRVDMHA